MGSAASHAYQPSKDTRGQGGRQGTHQEGTYNLFIPAQPTTCTYVIATETEKHPPAPLSWAIEADI